MGTNTIFSSETTPPFRVSFTETLSPQLYMGTNWSIEQIKLSLASKMADSLLKEPFFTLNNEDIMGVPIFTISMNAVVLTEEQLRSLLNETYAKGVMKGRYESNNPTQLA